VDRVGTAVAGAVIRGERLAVIRGERLGPGFQLGGGILTGRGAWGRVSVVGWVVALSSTADFHRLAAFGAGGPDFCHGEVGE
jgi:hypothetical protein